MTQKRLILKIASILSKEDHSIEVLAAHPAKLANYNKRPLKVLKCPAWPLNSLSTYKGSQLELAAYMQDSHPSPPELVIPVPPTVFSDLGYKEGDSLSRFNLFIEPAITRVKFYIAKPDHDSLV